MSLASLPKEILQNIATESENKWNLFQTSKDVSSLLGKTSEEKEALFRERFGALAEHEKSKSLDHIATFYQRAFNFDLTSSKVSLAFDKDGYPYINTEIKPAPLDSFSERYRAYRGGLDAETTKRLQEIFEEQANIVKEFEANTPNNIDASENIQAFTDFSDRVTRIYYIEKEREKYISAVQGSFLKPQDLSTIERICFSVISFFHSFFVPSFEELLSKYSLEITGDEFQGSRIVHLCDKMISYDNQELKLNLCLVFRNYISQIEVHEVETKTRLGYIPLELRRFENNDNYRDFKLNEFELPYLIESDIYLDSLKENDQELVKRKKSSTLNLLTQVAVEIFGRQSAEKLVIKTRRETVDHLALTGFWDPLDHLSRRCKEILGDRAQGRANNSLNLGGFPARLSKSLEPMSTNDLTIKTHTKFIRYEGYFHVGSPAIIDESVESKGDDKPSHKTWEEYIEKNGAILAPGKNGILPRIFANVRDL